MCTRFAMYLLATLLVLSITFITLPVFAQETEGVKTDAQLPDIVVKGRKEKEKTSSSATLTETPVIKIAQNIEVLPKRYLRSVDRQLFTTPCSMYQACSTEATRLGQGHKGK